MQMYLLEMYLLEMYLLEMYLLEGASCKMWVHQTPVNNDLAKS